MEVWHRISFSKKDNIDDILNSLKIEYKKNALPRGYTINFDIAESDSHWPQIMALTREKNGFDWYNTIFTKEEILDAEWVRLMPAFEGGYPQPKNYRKFIQSTYEIGCPRCGAGNRQKVPIRLVKEPNLVEHDFMSVFWTYSLFCGQHVLTELQKNRIQGYEIWPVIVNSTNDHSKVISQVLFPNIAQSALSDDDKIDPECCLTCGTPKYAYLRRGYMHLKRDGLIKEIDCQLTFEWFGGARFREILISPRFAKIIIENNWQGVSLKPIKLI
jgi:hypothetical protein